VIAEKHTLPYVSIIIPMYNAASTLRKCLDSLSRLDYPSDRLEIISVDGRSIDASREIAMDYPIRLIDNPKRRVVSGRNIGFEAARGELIAFSDADCTFDPSWIRNAVHYFDDTGVAGITGPIELPLDQNIVGKCIDMIFHLAVSFAGGVHETSVNSIRQVNHLPGCNAIFRSSGLKEVMPISEYFLEGEDVAMGHQLRLLGYQLLSVPDVKVQHYRRSTLRSFARQMYAYAIGRRRLSRVWTELLHPLHYIVTWILFIGLLCFGISLWINVVSGLFIIILYWVLVGSIGVIHNRKLAALFWQPLIVMVFLESWTLGFIRESLWPKR